MERTTSAALLPFSIANILRKDFKLASAGAPSRPTSPHLAAPVRATSCSPAPRSASRKRPRPDIESDISGNTISTCQVVTPRLQAAADRVMSPRMPSGARVPEGHAFSATHTDDLDTSSRDGHDISSDGSSDGSMGEPCKKKARSSFNPEQVSGLEQAYRTQHYLSTPERKQLAQKITLTERQIKTWFQNRRMKQKRQVQEPTSAQEHHQAQLTTPLQQLALRPFQLPAQNGSPVAMTTPMPDVAGTARTFNYTPMPVAASFPISSGHCYSPSFVNYGYQTPARQQSHSPS